MNPRAEPVGGSLVSRPTIVLGLLAILAFALIAWRFFAGLGPTTGLSDGYPWGLWIAYDVVTGTALACGGYALAILVYVFNRGRYHPLVRPAVLTSALGYTLAGLSVMIDVGRPWAAWRLAWPGSWNRSSVLLEVALCIMAYTVVLWIEMTPAFLEGARGPRLRKIANVISKPLEKAMPFLLALGLLLPTMHQSSLGSLMMIARSKLHPLWHTSFLPLLFLISVVGMGYAAVVIEASIASLSLRRKPPTAMLSSLSRVIPPLAGVWLLLRLGDLALRGRLGLVFGSGSLSGFFVLELVLVGGSAVMLLPAYRRTLPIAAQFRAAMLLLVGGALYRFDTFLVAFNPGTGWHYFPAVPELFITVGLVATEILGWVVIVKRFPILEGANT